MSTSTNFPSTLLHTLKTHTGPVNAVIFSSSPGTYLLTGSSDRSVHLSRALPSSSSSSPQITTSPIQRYEAHGYSVLDIAVSTDNARFASVGGDKQVFLWDVETGTTVRRWAGHSGRVEAVEFGGEADSVVISGSADSDVKIWDTRSLTSKPIQTLTEATDTVSSINVHLPTSSIITASYDGRIRTYDLRMGELKVDVMAHPVTSVQSSTDGKAILASCLDGRIRMVDRDDGAVLKSFGDGNPDPSAPAEKQHGPTYMNKELRIRSTFAKGDSVVLSGSESPEGNTSRSNTQANVMAWDVSTGNVIQTVPVGASVKVVSCVAWNEKGRSWAGGCSDGSVKVYG
ncbi:WD domain-containing protein [Arthroderma uncinatum]|uniref:WD domain-containing protein n=1 Tax=Arthroderma uncinatum TaxID=74035 RepID=UPI00144AF8DE|nr:WD domain-containing protein [Arthroderma uncinatum]KAF3479544.1 WD domain-containing protein [Arthroderma uncinatum]